jgi:hypothetical protein
MFGYIDTRFILTFLPKPETLNKSPKKAEKAKSFGTFQLDVSTFLFLYQQVRQGNESQMSWLARIKKS